MRRVTLLLVCLCGLTVAALAQEPGPRQAKHAGGRRGMPGGMDRETMLLVHMLGVPEVVEEIGIDEATATTLKDGIFKLREQQVEVRATLEKAGLEQARLLTEKDIDEDALMTAVEAAGAANTELAKLRMRQLLLVKQSLTAEQIEKAKAVVSARMAERRATATGRQGHGSKREKTRRGRGGEAAPPPE